MDCGGRITARRQPRQFVGTRHVHHAYAAHVLPLLAREGRRGKAGHAAHDAVGEPRALLRRHVLSAWKYRQAVDGDDAPNLIRMLLRDRQCKRPAQAMTDQHWPCQFAKADKLLQRVAGGVQHVAGHRRTAVEARQRHHVQHMVIAQGADRVLPHPAATGQAWDQDQRRAALPVALDSQDTRFEPLGGHFSGGEPVWRRWRVLRERGHYGGKYQCE